MCSNFITNAPGSNGIAAAIPQNQHHAPLHADEPAAQAVNAGSAPNGMHTAEIRPDVVATSGDVRYSHEFNTFNADRRRQFIVGLARRLNVDRAVLDSLDQRIMDEAIAADNAAHEAAAREAAERQAVESQGRDPLAGVPAETIQAAEDFLANPRMFDELRRDFSLIGIVGEILLSLTIYLICVSRKLSRPLSACVQSASSSGKSFVTENVVRLFPLDEVIQATSLTPQALYYMPEGSLSHKVVMVAERGHANAKNMADMANATMALREMISKGALDKYIPMKMGDEMVTVHLHQEGPISYVETTTQEMTFEEDATRLLFLTTDETPDQTLHIIERQAEEASGNSGDAAEVEAIYQKHRTAQQMLEGFTVLIPYAVHLRIPHSIVAARRAFRQLLSMIQTVALLRQRQKEVFDDGMIEADIDDYEVAYELMLPILRRAFMPVSEKALAVYNIIVARITQSPLCRIFTRGNVQDWSVLSEATVRNRLNALVQAGLVEPREGGQGSTYRYEVAPSHRRPGLGVNRFQSHDPHQPLHTLAVHVELIGHATAAVKRPL